MVIIIIIDIVIIIIIVVVIIAIIIVVVVDIVVIIIIIIVIRVSLEFSYRRQWNSVQVKIIYYFGDYTLLVSFNLMYFWCDKYYIILYFSLTILFS